MAGTSVHLPFVGRNHARIPVLSFIGMVGGPSWSVAASGNVAFVGDGPHVVALDMADPGRLREIGRTPPLPGLPLDIALDRTRGLAVVAASSGGIATIDVRDPTRLRLLGLTATGALTDARGVAIDGDTAVVAGGLGGFAAVDVREPVRPRVVGRLDPGFSAGSTGAVAARQGIAIAMPAFQGAEPPPDSYVINPLQSGVASFEQDLPAVIDISDPASPTLHARLPLSGTLGLVSDVELIGGRVFVASTTGAPCGVGRWCLEAFDLQSPEEPRRLSVPAGVTGEVLAVDEDRGLVLARGSRAIGGTAPGLTILDASSEAELAQVGSLATSARVGPIAMHGDRGLASSARGALPSMGVIWGRPLTGWPFAHDVQLDVFDMAWPVEPSRAGVHPLGFMKVHQLATFGDEVLALVEADPGDLGLRRMVWRIDPRTPARREIEWALQGSQRLHVQGETVFSVRIDGSRAEIGSFHLRQAGRARRMASARVTLGDPTQAPLTTWAGGQLWLAFPHLGSQDHPSSTSLVGLLRQGADGLIVTTIIPIEGSFDTMAAIGDRLLLADKYRLLLIDPHAADAEPLVLDELELPPVYVARSLAPHGDAVYVLGPNVLRVTVLKDRLLNWEIVSLDVPGLPRFGSARASALAAGSLVVSGFGGLRVLDVSERVPRLVAAAHMPPPIAADMARWPNSRPEYWVHGEMAIVQDTVLSEFGDAAGGDMPYRPIGLTSWRLP